MSQLINQIANWPIIIQGALGSGLFWLLLVLGQRLFEWSGKKISVFSHKFKQENLYREYIHKKLSRGPTRHEVLSMCTYQALSYLVRGFIFLGIGILLNPIASLSEVIGALGFVFYSFRALGWLKPFYIGSSETEMRRWSRIKEIEIELFGDVKDDTASELESLNSPNQ